MPAQRYLGRSWVRKWRDEVWLQEFNGRGPPVNAFSRLSEELRGQSRPQGSRQTNQLSHSFGRLDASILPPITTKAAQIDAVQPLARVLLPSNDTPFTASPTFSAIPTLAPSNSTGTARA